jgi:ElaB/YqjD/DUF883 family membrane-anchored ribosome-binding protein
MTLSSERLEQESEQIRLRLADSLEELRTRLSPGQVVDQLVDYASEGGAGEFVRNFGRDVRRNPLPVTLIGAGIGWLMMINGRSHRGHGSGDGERIAAGMTEAAHQGAAQHRADRPRAGLGVLGWRRAGAVRTWTDSAADTAHTIGEKTRTAGSAVADAGQQAGEWVSGLADRSSKTLPSAEDVSSVYQSAVSTASDTAHRLGDSATQLSRNARSLAQFCVEQPLVVVGLGFVFGTAIGAVLPSSETENQMLGATSDALKEKVKEQASEVYDKAQSVARDVVEAAGQSAEKAGLIDTAAWRATDSESQGAPSPATAG